MEGLGSTCHSSFERMPLVTTSISDLKFGYQEHGLQETMAGVILKCSKEQEAVSYRDAKPQFDATVLLSRVSRAIPLAI